MRRSVDYRSERAYESFAESFSNYDVIDPRIDVSAQQALIRLKGNPATRADAAAMLAAIKTGRLAGIYGDDLRAAAQLAARLGTVRWELVPHGQVAALIREPNPAAPPTIIFRTQYRGDRTRMDPALIAAWRRFHPHRRFNSRSPESEMHDGGEAQILPAGHRRVAVTDSLATPFRFICCLEIVFVNPNSGEELPERGTGTLISDRHVLTAAHNVFDDQSSKNIQITSSGRQPFPTQYLHADRVLVVPARHNRNKPVWFSGLARPPRIAPAWQAAANRQAAAGNTTHVFAPAQADFALLTLSQALGAQEPVSMTLGAGPLGFWGHPQLGRGTRINPRAPAELRNMAVNLSGYPTDRCPNPLSRTCPGTDPDDPDLRDQGSTQWRSFGNVVDPDAPGFPGMITYDLDTFEGQSGGPIWINWQGFRNLIAINTTGFPRATAPFDIIANMGVRITPAMLNQLHAWMREDT